MRRGCEKIARFFAIVFSDWVGGVVTRRGRWGGDSRYDEVELVVVGEVAHEAVRHARWLLRLWETGRGSGPVRSWVGTAPVGFIVLLDVREKRGSRSPLLERGGRGSRASCGSHGGGGTYRHDIVVRHRRSDPPSGSSRGSWHARSLHWSCRPSPHSETSAESPAPRPILSPQQPRPGQI